MKRPANLQPANVQTPGSIYQAPTFGTVVDISRAVVGIPIGKTPQPIGGNYPMGQSTNVSHQG